MTISTDKAFNRALERYARAREEKSWQWQYPTVSDYRDEQARLDEIHASINRELNHSRKLLDNLIDRRLAAVGKTKP